MKVKNISNPEEFLKVIDSCEGKSCGGAADGDRMAGVQFLSDGKRHFVYGCDGSGRNSRCQPFLPEKIIRYIKTTFHYIFHKKSL